MILFAQIAADKVAKFTQAHATNRVQLFVDASGYLLRVDDTKIWLTINPQLNERHGVAAVRLQAGQELRDFDSYCALHWCITLRGVLHSTCPAHVQRHADKFQAGRVDRTL